MSDPVEIPRDQLIRRLKLLQADVDRILDGALADPAVQNRISEPINWADLRCVETASCINHAGGEYLTVSIEEAAPDAEKLKRYVQKKLVESGWRDMIHIGTEW